MYVHADVKCQSGEPNRSVRGSARTVELSIVALVVGNYYGPDAIVAPSG